MNALMQPDDSYNRGTVKRFLAAGILLLLAGAGSHRRLRTLPGPRPDGTTRLHDGWSISPLGKAVPVGTLPLALYPLPGGRAAVLLCGYAEEGIDIVDFASGSAQRIPMPRAWLGLAGTRDGATLYASGGADNLVRVFRLEGSAWREGPPLVLGAPKDNIFAGGLFLDEERGRLYVCENLAGRLAVFDVATGHLVGEHTTGGDPYAVVVTQDASRAYVSDWRDSDVAEIPLDGSTGRRFLVGAHPTSLVLDPGRPLLYVACAQSDTVAVVDRNVGRTLWNVSTALTPGDPQGATPSALALSPDASRLLVADSDNHDVAVVDVSVSPPAVEGFLPVGRYPTAVAFDVDGGILVADGKGSRTFARPARGRDSRYVLDELIGDVRRIGNEELRRLPQHTARVQANRPARGPEPSPRAERGRIRHVIYVIKENRTYDQVLGDDPRGNGDPALALFGRAVTPNHHAIAREFTLLDNFYCNAEVSAQGHTWSMGAFSNDYVERTFAQTYSHRGREYDYEGRREIAAPRAGYLWDAAARAGIAFRIYGEFLEAGKGNEPAWTHVKALAGRFDPLYRPWDLDYQDTDRIEEWRREFRGFERDGNLPALEIVKLPNDHTAAGKTGSLTPAAMVGDNDLALGRLVETVTHSRYFSDTAVFVVEDDAQNGPDHVDCHRSVAFVVSPFTPRRRVDSRMYTTASVVRTIGRLLGLAPLTQYDERAVEMDFETSGLRDLAAFTARPASVDLEARNPARGPGERESARLDLSREDAAPDRDLADALYLAAVGRRAPPPTVAYGIMSAQADGE
jgi:hypothetical protein